jgi:hypothetical protein
MENNIVNSNLKIFGFVSQPKKTIFAPEWTYWLAEDTITDIDFSEISDLILEKEKSILEKFPSSTKTNADGYTGLGADSLTARYQHYNLLLWENQEIKKIKTSILKTYLNFLEQVGAPRRKVWIQCWANVLRKNQEIKPHIHSVTPYSYLGGHICVQCTDTSTIYINPINQINDPEIYSSKNEVGKITIFQNSIPHYTSKHVSNTERITIAFDIIVDELLNPDNATLVLLDDGANIVT